ncbi:MAG: c-type cytochrome [Polyangiaceae bacterium]
MKAAALFSVTLAFAASFAVFACSKKEAPVQPPAPAATDASVDKEALNDAEGKRIVRGACLSCHSEELLAQQRLPKAKWEATVKKMIGWGANVDATETEPLVAYLSRMYGPDAGAWEPEPILASDAVKRLEPQSDGVFAGGSAETGKGLYAERCSGCHGADARGSIGLDLVERPVLYRASDVAANIRMGRGKMAPVPRMTDREIADVLAYLRTLRLP